LTTTPQMSSVISALLLSSYFHCLLIITYQPPPLLALVLTTCIFSTLLHHVVNSKLTLWIDRICMISLLVIEFFIFMAISITPLYQLFHFLALLAALESYALSQVHVPEINKKNKIIEEPSQSHGILLILSYLLIFLHHFALLYSLSRS
jgi:hypothetical protein